jgi:hypothetical protein
MRSRGLIIASAVLGLIGFALVIVESVEALRRIAFSTLDSILLYAGLGAFVMAAVMLTAAMSDVSERAESGAATQPQSDAVPAVLDTPSES